MVYGLCRLELPRFSLWFARGTGDQPHWPKRPSRWRVPFSWFFRFVSFGHHHAPARLEREKGAAGPEESQSQAVNSGQDKPRPAFPSPLPLLFLSFLPSRILPFPPFLFGTKIKPPRASVWFWRTFWLPFLALILLNATRFGLPQLPC